MKYYLLPLCALSALAACQGPKGEKGDKGDPGTPGAAGPQNATIFMSQLRSVHNPQIIATFRIRHEPLEAYFMPVQATCGAGPMGAELVQIMTNAGSSGPIPGGRWRAIQDGVIEVSTTAPHCYFIVWQPLHFDS